MNLPLTLLIGGGAHALVGAGIFFAKEEPHKMSIFVATILKGLLVALLIAFSLASSATHTLWHGAGYGLLYGLVFGVVVFLAKGADFAATPHILSGSAIQGVITGVLIALFALAPVIQSS
jgi:hypothetical protein